MKLNNFEISNRTAAKYTSFLAKQFPFPLSKPIEQELKTLNWYCGIFVCFTAHFPPEGYMLCTVHDHGQ